MEMKSKVALLLAIAVYSVIANYSPESKGKIYIQFINFLPSTLHVPGSPMSVFDPVLLLSAV